jgi:NADH-quinone oxidoreductase subunit J
MTTLFYLSSLVAVVATALAITRANAVHGLLYLVVSFLAVALIFYVLGAPFAAALEVIIYAGAIMVLFVFVVMMLNVTAAAGIPERHALRPALWAGPAVLSAILVAELGYMMLTTAGRLPDHETALDARHVGVALYGPYLLAVELASMLLLAGLVAAYHLARGEKRL